MLFCPWNSPGYLSNLGIEPGSPTWQADSLPSEPSGKPQTPIRMAKIQKTDKNVKQQELASSASRNAQAAWLEDDLQSLTKLITVLPCNSVIALGI